MNQVTTSLNSGLRSFVDFLPALIGGIALVLLAWIVAVVVRQAITKGLRAAKFDHLLVKWKAAQSEDQAKSTIDTLGMVAYYLVWVLFLPGIFDAFHLPSIAAPISNMLQTALNFLPNLIGAAVLLIVGFVAARLVKNLVFNLAKSMDLDRWMRKLTGSNRNNRPVTAGQKDTIASVLANIVYVLVLIPIITIALETLNIRSISEPIINVLNVLLGAIPNILVAVILLGVGLAIAKFVGSLVTNLLQGTGVDNLTSSMNFDISGAVGQLVAVLIGLFFFVEALNALNLAVLNTIGTAIILYLPNVLFALVILALALIGGRLLANGVTRAIGSRFAGKLVEYVLLAFGVFMALSQLNLASTIVDTAFIFIIGGLSVAFALAFGLGGRDFAQTQLKKLDSKMQEEKGKNESAPYEGLEDKMKQAGKQATETKGAKAARPQTPPADFTGTDASTRGARPETGSRVDRNNGDSTDFETPHTTRFSTEDGQVHETDPEL